MRYTSDLSSGDLTFQAVRALVLYSLAEFQSGHATTLHVSASGTAFSVYDDGRGHAVNRTIAGAPYLQFIYTHLDYPFGTALSRPVQLHGIGMSLLNALCSDLSVTVRKPDGTLLFTYRAGHLSSEEHLEPTATSTGTTVSGSINPEFESQHTNPALIEEWLLAILAARETLINSASPARHMHA